MVLSDLSTKRWAEERVGQATVRSKRFGWFNTREIAGYISTLRCVHTSHWPGIKYIRWFDPCHFGCQRAFQRALDGRNLICNTKQTGGGASTSPIGKAEGAAAAVAAAARAAAYKRGATTAVFTTAINTALAGTRNKYRRQAVAEADYGRPAELHTGLEFCGAAAVVHSRQVHQAWRSMSATFPANVESKSPISRHQNRST